MQPQTPDHVFDLIDGYVASAALGAALEHGIFWLVADEPATPARLAADIGVREDRMGAWLELLTELGRFKDHKVADVVRITKSNYSAPVEPELLAEAEKWQAIISGIGD